MSLLTYVYVCVSNITDCEAQFLISDNVASIFMLH